MIDKQIRLALKKFYNIDPKGSKELSGYYDRNFQVYDGKKKEFVKLFGGDNQAAVKFQIDFINACHGANVPVAQVLKTKTGEQQILVLGKPLIAQEFLEGKLLIDVPHTLTLLREIGEVLGRIHAVSSEQKFKGSEWKEYEWDLAQFDLVVNNFKKAASYLTREQQSLVKSVFFDWKLETSQLRSLRKGVIHNDFNGLNLLIENNHCSGVVDFGDTMKSWFAADVAIALMHICLSKPKPFVKTRALFLGYRKYFNLTKKEKELLPLLSRMRGATITICHKKDFGDNPPKDYKKIFNDAVRVLKLLADERNQEKLKIVIKGACD